MFTLFGTKSREAVRPAKGGLYFLSDHEGPLVSVRRPHTVTKGLYTFTLQVTDTGSSAGKPFHWVKAVVRTPDGQSLEVGSLRFDVDKLTTGRTIGSFLEVPGRFDIPAPTEFKMPGFRMAVGGWTLDGKEMDVRSVTVGYDQKVPQRANVLMYSQLTAVQRKGLHPVFEREPGHVIVVDEKDWPRNPNAQRVNIPPVDHVKHLAPPITMLIEHIYLKK